MEIGIRYLNRDYFAGGSQAGNGIDTGKTVLACPMTNAQVQAGLCPHIPISFIYQVVVRKRGTWGSPSGTYDVFQFDGREGLNIFFQNFRYRLSGLDNLRPTPCFVDVTLSPDAGLVRVIQVQASSNGFVPATPRQPFSISLTKQCSIPLQIDGYFETPGIVQNGLLVPASDSNFDIGIEDRRGNAIPFNQQFASTRTPGNVATQTVAFDAILKSFGRPKTGPFSETATVRLFLY